MPIHIDIDLSALRKVVSNISLGCQWFSEAGYAAAVSTGNCFNTTNIPNSTNSQPCSAAPPGYQQMKKDTKMFLSA